MSEYVPVLQDDEWLDSLRAAEAQDRANGVSYAPQPEPADAWLAGTPMDPLAVAAEPLPALPGFPMLQKGGCALIVGPTGGGRSFVMEAGAYVAAQAGLRVAYLGYEVTEGEFNARAARLAEIRGDAVDDELRTALARVRYLDLPETISRAWQQPEQWAAGVLANFDLVIVDPLSAVESTLGLNFQSDNSDYVRFHDKIVHPISSRGTTFINIENVGHALEAKSRAKGASAKQDRADLVFSCRLASSPAALILKAEKVRSVRAGYKRGDEWIVPRDTQVIAPHRRGDEGGEGAERFRPTVIMERVSEYVERNRESGKRDIRSGTRGKNEFIDQAIEILVEDGFIARGEQGYTSLKPYRAPDGAPDPVPPVPPVPSACPERAPEAAGGCAPGAYLKGHRGTSDSVPDVDLVERAERVLEEHEGEDW